MRVLMVNHPACEAFRGGDLVQMRRTAAALRFYGVRVTESLAPDPSPTGFDLAHVFNLRTARALGLAVPRSLLATADVIVD